MEKLDTDIELLDDEAEDAAEADGSLEYEHYELDDPRDVTVAESLGKDIDVETEYVLGVETKFPIEEATLATIQQYYQGEEDMPEEVHVTRLHHSDADGGIGVTLREEADVSLDDIIDRFSEPRTAEEATAD